MNIRKNVAETLYRILDGRSEKEKIVKICNDIEESNHAMKYAIQFDRNIDQIIINSLPWMLTKQQSNVVKEVTWKVKFPTGFCANMMNIITKKGDFAGVKTYDWNVFMKVIIMVSISFFFNSNAYCCYFFLSNLCLNNDVVCILLQYGLPLFLLNNFNNNVKQVIYNCNVPDPLTSEEDATNTKHVGKYPHEHEQAYNAVIKIPKHNTYYDV